MAYQRDAGGRRPLRTAGRRADDSAAPRYPDSVTVHPIKTTVEVCLRCGSTEPMVLTAECPHPHVARFVELRPELADLVTRLRRARSYQAHVAGELAAAAALEQLAGRAVLDDEPEVFLLPAGVVFLRPRDERYREPVVDPEGESPSPPWSSAPATNLPAPPQPGQPRHRRGTPAEQPELFAPTPSGHSRTPPKGTG